MFANIPEGWLLLGALVTFMAGFVQGFSGFGFAIVFTPIFSLIFGSPQEVVFLAPILGFILSTAVMIEARRALRRKHALPLLLATAIGTPLGIGIRTLLNIQALKLVIATLALLIAFLRLFKFPLKIPDGYRTLATGGFLGGLLNGTTSMGGPVPSLIIAFQNWDVHEARAALVSFNLLSYFLATTVALGAHIAKFSWFTSILWLLPFAAFGSICGVLAVRYVSRLTFALFITGIVGLSGCVGLTSIILKL
ncbi:sulfite exporter TauE/SafE family protein [Acidiphilium iwatense]|uniref:Probable membrane transporter protein n=1 Tax=Acidiphilium iwatense TaxID=768198 RepID=A0ABS9E5S6_9PROT|nr:sulfite exporter TauE/SafE family protein [Acidiphilium iwatense]MCF3948972.1 sulfite exporter TauE/SafE family protein [Acidiphilium iwatense]